MRVLVAAFASLLMSATASAAPEEAAGSDCFHSTSWRGWSSAEEGDALYLRMSDGDVFRVELTPGARVHRRAGTFLVNQARGSSRVCSALDLDLSLSDINGFARPIIATGLRKLTPEEVAAIAPDDVPY